LLHKETATEETFSIYGQLAVSCTVHRSTDLSAGQPLKPRWQNTDVVEQTRLHGIELHGFGPVCLSVTRGGNSGCATLFNIEDFNKFNNSVIIQFHMIKFAKYNSTLSI
jgi:hypothetical protein